jgi:hypothetical protein
VLRFAGVVGLHFDRQALLQDEEIDFDRIAAGMIARTR